MRFNMAARRRGCIVHRAAVGSLAVLITVALGACGAAAKPGSAAVPSAAPASHRVALSAAAGHPAAAHRHVIKHFSRAQLAHATEVVAVSVSRTGVVVTPARLAPGPATLELINATAGVQTLTLKPLTAGQDPRSVRLTVEHPLSMAVDLVSGRYSLVTSDGRLHSALLTVKVGK